MPRARKKRFSDPLSVRRRRKIANVLSVRPSGRERAVRGKRRTREFSKIPRPFPTRRGASSYLPSPISTSLAISARICSSSSVFFFSLIPSSSSFIRSLSVFKSESKGFDESEENESSSALRISFSSSRWRMAMVFNAWTVARSFSASFLYSVSALESGLPCRHSDRSEVLEEDGVCQNAKNATSARTAMSPKESPSVGLSFLGIGFGDSVAVAYAVR